MNMPSQKNKYTAGVLAIIFGVLGIHKLYLGKVGFFFLFIFLFIISTSVDFPITAFWGLIEGLVLLFMSDAEFDKKYNRGIIAARRGPLDVRREEQLKRYHQLPGQKPVQSREKNQSAQAVVKANALKTSGIKKYKDFDLEDAILDFQEGLTLMQNDPALHFNLACAYSLTEKKNLAYHHLALSVANGLNDVQRILTHEDLAFVRIQPEFDEFRKSGFKQYPSSNSEAPSTTQSSQESDHIEEKLELDDTVLGKLNKLSELRSKGIISQDEFDFERKKMMNR